MQERGADEASGQGTHRASSTIPDTGLPADPTDAHDRTTRTWRPAARAAERTAARDLMRADVSVHVPRRSTGTRPARPERTIGRHGRGVIAPRRCLIAASRARE